MSFEYGWALWAVDVHGDSEKSGLFGGDSEKWEQFRYDSQPNKMSRKQLRKQRERSREIRV